MFQNRASRVPLPVTLPPAPVQAPARIRPPAPVQARISAPGSVGTVPVAALLALLLAPAPHLGAQLIPIRTVPVASGDQFLTVPSANLGMAGTRIAVDDSIADLWSNPAKGVFIAEPAVLGAPTFFHVSDDGGAAKTFPFTGLLRHGAWFGGASVALQQVSAGRGGGFWRVPPGRLSDRSARNLYGRAAIGRTLGEGGWSFGGAVSRASLEAMTGVDKLYAGADRIDQEGAVTDVRAGLFRDGGRDRFGFTVIHNRVSMQHEVHYTDIVARDSITFEPTFEFREELNQDRTRTLAGHFEWDREIGTEGWRSGATLTVNYKSHPKIPNYELQDIPRDPGNTWAYEIGFGIGRTRESTTFGVDLAYQPIWSHTWQEAESRTETPRGFLDVGDKTIENHFAFSNVVLRSGISQRYERFGFQLGLEARSYAYHLEQEDHVEGTRRDLDEAWTEWTPTLATHFRFQDIDLRWSIRITSGTGFPGIDLIGGDDVQTVEAAAPSPDFIAAPRGALTLDGATVVTHQVWIRVPIR